MVLYLKLLVDPPSGRNFSTAVRLSDKYNVFKFMQMIIDSSGKTTAELNKLKPKEVISMVLGYEGCTFTKEKAEKYDLKPIVAIFRRVLAYNVEFDPYKVMKDCDALKWWASTASIEERLAVFTSVNYGKHGWTSAMQDTAFSQISVADTYRIFECVQEEPWTERYRKESKENREIFDKNNVLFKLLEHRDRIILRNYEVFLPFYDKIVTITLQRKNKGSSFMSNLTSILSMLKKSDPRIFLTIGNQFSTYEVCLSYAKDDRWGPYGLLMYTDTDMKARAKSYHLNSRWKGPDVAGYKDALLWGSYSSRGIGFHNTASRRMGMWQPI